MGNKKKNKDVRPRLTGAKLANFNFFNNKES